MVFGERYVNGYISGSYQNRMVTDEVVGVERSVDGFMDKAYSAN